MHVRPNRLTWLSLVTTVVMTFVTAAAITWAVDRPGDGGSRANAQIKAHLTDGTVALFPDGLGIDELSPPFYLRGNGRMSQDSALTGLALPVSGVSALEFYDDRLTEEAVTRTANRNGSTTIDAYQTSASMYTYNGSRYVLEAEAFSTSLLSAVEADDLDRLDAGVEVDGSYRLRLSNHALETQYVNALSLKVVDHEAGFEVFPTRKRKLVEVGATTPVIQAMSRDGREVSKLLESRDGNAYRTAPEVARELTQRITKDWVEFEVQVPLGVREFYVTMQSRNTLFNNVLLEDALLTGKGLETLDLLGGKRFRVLEMWRLYRWVKKNIGLQLQVYRNGRFKTIDRIGGTGPSAWRQTVVVVPVQKSGPTRVRLSFMADSWMIDWIGVSFEGDDRVESTSIPLASLRSADGALVSPENVQVKDKNYLAIYPGETYDAVFDVGPQRGARRTFFVETKGYLVKWLSPEQVVGSVGSFKPRDEDVLHAAQRWLAEKQEMERAFERGSASQGR